jgi:hypothetical protein
MGVFATRSPFRPNPIGLSSVRLVAIEDGELIVSGADVLDGTPIYDIKPYLSFSDSHPDARNGFAEETKDYRLKVDGEVRRTDVGKVRRTDVGCTKDVGREGSTKGCGLETIWRDIEYILSQDPRPAYQDDPEREYKMDYAGCRVTFTVKETTVTVKKIEKI